MNRFLASAGVLLGLGYYLASHTPGPPTPGDPSLPPPLNKPLPNDDDDETRQPNRRRPRRPRRDVEAPGRPVEGGKKSPDGAVEVVCDLPESERKHNVGGSDGAGLCVFTSIEYSARFQNVPELIELQQFMRSRPGGGYPEKVDKILKEVAPNVQYIQDTSGDPAILELALKTGRYPAVTYNGHDCHYSGGIAHMVSCPYYDHTTGWACVSDNNFTHDNQFVWMSCEEFLQRWKGHGGGWVVILLAPPPPPVPHP